MVRAATGVLERAGGVGERAAGTSFSEVRNDGEQARRRPRRIPGQARVAAAVDRGADLRRRPGGGVLRCLPQPLPFLRSQPGLARCPVRSGAALGEQ